MTLFKPVQFGKYLLLDRIAMGGMAELFRAKITGEKGFEKLIAIKKVLPHLTSEKHLIGSFIDEAKLAAYLQHQNIVQIYDFGSTDGAYFIAMEYLLGKDLRQTIRQGRQKSHPLTLENSLYITAQICNGLDYAHKLKDFHEKPLNIIHRDIGPQNIFITYDGHVKIIDFGIAKASIQDTTTQVGSIKGKVAYMSPEQAMGEPIDCRSDIFSIGILLYEMVTSKRMYEGDTFKAYASAREAEFEPAEKVNSHLPQELYMILDRALKKDRDERYQTAADMLADIDNLIASLSLQPSDRTLSRYMIDMFKDEAQAEENAMREAALTHNSVRSESDKLPPEMFEETIILATEDIPGKKKSLRRYYALIVILMALSWVFFPVYYPEYKVAIKRMFVSFDKRQTKMHNERELKQLNECEKLIKAGQFEDAIKMCETIQTAETGMRTRVAHLHSSALRDLASGIIQKEPDRAKGLLIKSVILDPENANGPYLLGRLYAAQNDTVSAISMYQRAVELDSGMVNAFFNMGYIYATNGKYIEARKMYERVIELAPPFLDEALFNLAVIQVKNGEKEAGISNLEKAAGVNPQNKQVIKLLEKLKPTR